MDPSTPPDAAITRARLDQLCRRYEATNFVELAARFDATEPLTHIVDAVRCGHRIAELATALDSLDHAFALNGIDGLTTPRRTYRPLPGSGHTHSTYPVWTCPAPRPCHRRTLDIGLTPTCAMTGLPLIAGTVTT
ncbi:hypothetical protein [Nocardia vinacea]|uniref:hypothetical protein n=1 Tax=Nocardia vinacea TaxID=96468 RepID=UPI0002DF8A3F|nr:hypothetical protein [Nocardia vinacea]